ncbi:MAG: carbon-nitrogen family hydrolase [Mycobacteriales bacterium]
MKLAAVQLSISDAEPSAERLAVAEDAVSREAAGGADLILLPEMWLPGYFGFDRYSELAEGLDDGPTTSRLADLARENSVWLCAGSLVERRGGKLFNTTLLFDPQGRRVAEYRKIHLFGYGSREQELLTPGDEVVTVDVAGCRTGLSTCYDLRFPELYRAQVDQGAKLFLIVAGWPFPRLDAWRCLLQARAVENQAFVVACNAAGSQAGSTFLGASAAFDPWGVCLGSLDYRPGVLEVKVEPEAATMARAEFPALADRRMGGS